MLQETPGSGGFMFLLANIHGWGILWNSQTMHNLPTHSRYRAAPLPGGFLSDGILHRSPFGQGGLGGGK